MWVGSLSPRKLFSDLGIGRISPLPHSHSYQLQSAPVGEDGTLFFLLCGWTVCFSPGNNFSTLHPPAFFRAWELRGQALCGGSFARFRVPVCRHAFISAISQHPTRAPEAWMPHKYLEAPTTFQRARSGRVFSVELVGVICM